MNLVNEGVLPPDEMDDRDERREEQERARRRETVADIVADLRECAQISTDSAERIKYAIPKELLKSQAEIYGVLADRIEAAWKRDEERAVEHATRHAECVARDNCRDCVYNPSGKNYEGGNAAAMREALENAYSLLCEGIATEVDDELEHPFHLELAREKIQDALSAPPRNCDLYATYAEAVKAHEEYASAHIARASNKFDFPMEFDKWLFAPAEERKGDGDGK